MRVGGFILFSISLVATNLFAQKLHYLPQRYQPDPKRRLYAALYVGAENLFYRKPEGALSISFPYTSMNHSGTITPGVFNGAHSTPFALTPWTSVNINFQAGIRGHFADLVVNFGYYGSYFMFGYGHTLNSAPLWGTVHIKTLVDIGFLKMKEQIGSGINNHGNIISALGRTADSTFTYSTGGRRSPRVTHTANASEMDVYYRQIDWGLLPKLALEWHPKRRDFNIELTIAYFIPISKKGFIRFDQTDGQNHHHIVGELNLNEPGLTSTYNTIVISSAPFSFQGLQVGVKIGFSSFYKKL